MKKNLLPVVLFACTAISVMSCASTGKTASKAKGEIMKNSVTKEGQTLNMETLGNARELGGYVNQDGKKVKRGVLLRSAKPAGASTNDLARLKNEYHLKTIIDFRMGFERDTATNPQI